MTHSDLPKVVELQMLRDIKDVIVIVQDGVIKFINRMLPGHGFTAEEMIGKPAFEMGVDHRPNQEDQAPAMVQSSVRCKDGGRMPIEVAAGSTRLQDKPAIIASVRDTTSQVQAQRDLAERENIIRSLCDVAFDGMVIHREGIVQEANQAFCDLLGASMQEVIGKSVYDFLLPEVRDRVLKHDSTGSHKPCREIGLMAKGPERPFELVGKNITFQGCPARIMAVRKMEQQESSEQQRPQMPDRSEYAQKLESLFIMAGGIAHDLNNMLMGIMGNASLALHRLPKGTMERTCVEEIEATSQRITDLTRQLLAFSGCGLYQLESIELSWLLPSIVTDLEKSSQDTGWLEVIVDDDLPKITADAKEIRQVLENLVANALEAYGDEMGSVQIHVGSRVVDKDFFGEAVPPMTSAPQGRYVFLEVRDFGCGMDSDLRAKIFDPYFSTKFTGRGLGLPVVLGISQAHHWAIKVSSEVGKGSTFTVFFPAIDEARSEGSDYPLDEHPTPQTNHLNTVLLIDDEYPVLQVTQKMLDIAGYRVLVANSGQAGIDLYQQYKDEIWVVLLDATMPGMDGYATFLELRRIRPTVQVILCSGYDKKVTGRFAGQDLVGFLQKPYRLEEVTSLLDQLACQQNELAVDAYLMAERRTPLS